MPSNHLILCHPLLLLPSIFPSIRVFSNEPALCIRWPKYWSFSFSISPSNEYSGLISFRMDWFELPAVQGTLKSLLQHHSSKESYHQRIRFSKELETLEVKQRPRRANNTSVLWQICCVTYNLLPVSLSNEGWKKKGDKNKKKEIRGKGMIILANFPFSSSWSYKEIVALLETLIFYSLGTNKTCPSFMQNL